MELRHLRLVLEIAERGNFTSAARALFVSQPAVSQAVADLERELGTPLFARLGRRVTPTSAGEAVVARARTILRQVDAIHHDMAGAVGLAAGRLDLSALRTLAAAPVADLIGRFRQAHPAITVHLASPDSPVHLVDQVHHGVAEVGITALDTPVPTLVTRPLATEELVVALPAGTHAASDHLDVDGLAGLPLIATPSGTSSRAHLDDALEQIGATPTIVVETAQREAILPLVLSGAGAALISATQADAARRLGAHVLPLRPTPTRDLVVVHRPGRLTPAAVAFLDVVAGGGAPTGDRPTADG